MKLKLHAFFNDGNGPVSGLAPLAYLFDLTLVSLLLDGAIMTEIGSSGIYNLEYTPFDPSHLYLGVFKAGTRTSIGFSRRLNDVDIQFIKDIEGGRWKREGTEMVFFKDDNTTEIARFDLFNKFGEASDVNIWERKRSG